MKRKRANSDGLLGAVDVADCGSFDGNSRRMESKTRRPLSTARCSQDAQLICRRCPTAPSNRDDVDDVSDVQRQKQRHQRSAWSATATQIMAATVALQSIFGQGRNDVKNDRLWTAGWLQPLAQSPPPPPPPRLVPVPINRLFERRWRKQKRSFNGRNGVVVNCQRNGRAGGRGPRLFGRDQSIQADCLVSKCNAATGFNQQFTL